MATIFNRGFLLRSLPALLALVLGLLVAPQQPGVPGAVVIVCATALVYLAAPVVPARPPGDGPVEPVVVVAGPVEWSSRVLRSQVVVGVAGSRAPPSLLV